MFCCILCCAVDEICLTHDEQHGLHELIPDNTSPLLSKLLCGEHPSLVQRSSTLQEHAQQAFWHACLISRRWCPA